MTNSFPACFLHTQVMDYICDRKLCRFRLMCREGRYMLYLWTWGTRLPRVLAMLVCCDHLRRSSLGRSVNIYACRVVGPLICQLQFLRCANQIRSTKSSLHFLMKVIYFRDNGRTCTFCMYGHNHTWINVIEQLDFQAPKVKNLIAHAYYLLGAQTFNRSMGYKALTIFYHFLLLTKKSPIYFMFHLTYSTCATICINSNNSRQTCFKNDCSCEKDNIMCIIIT